MIPQEHFEGYYKDALAKMKSATQNSERRRVDRIPELLGLLQEIWTTETEKGIRYDDLRFFQLLYNIFDRGQEYRIGDLFHEEDETTILVLKEYLREIKER